MKRLGAILGTALLLSLGTSVPADAGPESTPRAAGTKVMVVSHNTDGLGTRAGLATKGADAYTFQEICVRQAASLRKRGWKVSFAPRIAHKDCGGKKVKDAKKMKGVAVVSKHRLGKKRTIDLGVRSPGGHFGALCVPVIGAGVARLVVCTTHLAVGGTNAPADRAAQAATIATAVNGYVKKGDRVILTGDFNAAPTEASLNPIYKVGKDAAGTASTGTFWEGDQMTCGTPCRDMQVTTTKKNKKIDYFFVSSPGVGKKRVGKTVKMPSTNSHHKVVVGRATFKPLR